MTGFRLIASFVLTLTLGVLPAQADSIEIRGLVTNFGRPSGPALKKQLLPSRHDPSRVDLVLTVEPSQDSLGQTEFQYLLPRGVYIGPAYFGDNGRTKGIYFENLSSQGARLAILRDGEWKLDSYVEIVWNGETTPTVRVNFGQRLTPSEVEKRFGSLHNQAN